MAWDTTDHSELTLARLKASAPDVVYRELKDYAAHVVSMGHFWGDNDLESALAERNDRLIDLGLARYGANRAIVATLYKKAVAGTGDSKHDRGIRLACWSNQASAMGALMEDSVFDLDDTEMRRLALEGDPEELICMLKNPSVGGLLSSLYAGEKPFDDLPDERRLRLVRASTGNPRLNLEDDNEEGPDLIALHIHKGIFSLLESLPVTPESLRTLTYLLIDLEPSRVITPAEGAAAKVLQRWATLKMPRLYAKDGEEQEGHFTDLTFAEEFRCLVAALYGKTLNKNNFDVIGKPDDSDIALRCAYYGNAKMTPEELRQAFEKDGATAAFAALFNDSVLLTRETRPVLEDQLRGRERLSLYTRRCERLAQKWKWFDPRPVSETMREVVQMMEPPTSRPIVESTAVTDLKAQLEALKASQAKLVKSMTWGFVVVVGVLLFVR